MDLSETPRRPRAESIVPMINVVFLLLIFFLMTSRLVQPDPVELALPESATGRDANADPVLFVGKNGQLHYGGLQGAEAVARLVAENAHSNAHSYVIKMRADAALEATVLARILRDLAAAGLARVELVVVSK